MGLLDQLNVSDVNIPVTDSRVQITIVYDVMVWYSRTGGLNGYYE